MNIIFPQSSLVTFMVYDESESIMGVAFNGGAVYMYEDVSPQQWLEIIGAESVGARLNAFFKYNSGIKAKNSQEAAAWILDTETELNNLLEDAYDNAYTYYDGES